MLGTVSSEAEKRVESVSEFFKANYPGITFTLFLTVALANGCCRIAGFPLRCRGGAAFGSP